MTVSIIFQTNVLSTAASSDGTHPGAVKKKEQPSPFVSESRVSNFLCLLF